MGRGCSGKRRIPARVGTALIHGGPPEGDFEAGERTVKVIGPRQGPRPQDLRRSFRRVSSCLVYPGVDHRAAPPCENRGFLAASCFLCEVAWSPLAKACQGQGHF